MKRKWKWKLNALTVIMVLGFCLPASAQSAENHAGFQNNPERTGVYQTGGSASLEQVKWKFKTNGKIYASPIVVDGITYIGSEDGNFYAIDNRTGSLLWKLATGGGISSTAAVDQGRIFFNSRDGYFYAADSKTGKRLWRFKTKGEKVQDTWDYYLSSPAVHEDTVYFGSGDGSVYALDVKTGKSKWTFKTGGIVHASPAIHNNKLYIGSFDGHMYALDMKTGKMKWKFKTVGDTWFPLGEIQGSASIDDGIVYFGSRDYNVYALDAETGTGKWNYKVPNSWVISTPAIADGKIFFGASDDFHIYAMDAKTGEQRWKFPVNLNTFGSGAVSEGTLYIGNFNGKLYALDIASGEVKGVFQTQASKDNYSQVFDENGKFRQELMDRYWNGEGEAVFGLIMTLGSILSSPALDEGVVYFGSTDGYVYAVQ